MGGCSSLFHYDENRTESGEIPQPVVLREKNFAFIHYTNSKITYSRIEEVLLAIPNYLVSEISSYQVVDPNSLIPTKTVTKISGIDADSKELRGALLVEKFKTKTLVQFGNHKTIDLILNFEDARFLYKKKFSATKCSIKCSEVLRFLYRANENRKGERNINSSVIKYIKAVIR